jgi:hypothetical protein
MAESSQSLDVKYQVVVGWGCEVTHVTRQSAPVPQQATRVQASCLAVTVRCMLD